ncbi:techylectin-5B-like [Dendronephthya gigantea]|uniref:techylectin-5B-like n=1 Tax=Dendronephthya gigantea TaxID=151771 RepID=UPI00106D5D05|nr:techylectin-5B-like [Dendronephthya gigantea]
MFKILTLILLIVKIACMIAQDCSPRIYSVIRTGGSTLPPDEIISNHTVNSGIVPIECYELCQKQPKCVGFNYRDTTNVVNCQLTNITKKRADHNLIIGKWLLMLDEEAAKNDKEERRKNDMDSATSCAQHYNLGARKNGVYTIHPDGLGSFQVLCDMSIDGGGWTVFQRRQNGSQNFYLGWSDYKAGFGNLTCEFWLGLDKIHRLSKSKQNILRVDLMDFNNTERYAKYGTFSVADESDKYRLTIDKYSGDAGDSLAYHNQMQFTTKDSDNDIWENKNCATRRKGAWWYTSCLTSNLNGLYLAAGQNSSTGIRWNKWHTYSMRKTEMKIRPSHN